MFFINKRRISNYRIPFQLPKQVVDKTPNLYMTDITKPNDDDSKLSKITYFYMTLLGLGILYIYNKHGGFI